MLPLDCVKNYCGGKGKSGKFDVGDRIECRHEGGDVYYPGVIKRARKDGTYDIDYDDGDKEKSVEASLIKRERKPSKAELVAKVNLSVRYT